MDPKRFVLGLAVAIVCAACIVPAHAAPSLYDTYIRGPIDCVKQNSSVICDDMDGCTWCTSTSIGTGCYPLKATKVLPKKYFTCDKPPSSAARSGTINPANPRTKLSVAQRPKASPVDDEICDKRSEDSCIAPDCVWCTSAAVGGGCYTPAQAKLLPSAIFKCKTAPSATAAA